MRLGKIVTLLLAGFLTFSSLNSLAATKNTKTKSSLSTKKQTTPKSVKKPEKTTASKTNGNATKVKKVATVKKAESKTPTKATKQTADKIAKKASGKEAQKVVIADKNSKKAVNKLTKKERDDIAQKGNLIKQKSVKELHKNTARKHYQTGVASYYANKFNGRRTANGEIFNNAKMTAAHRTLPFGTLIEVTNLGNGRSVIVRINDRGPYAHARVVDLSSAAAKQIGMHHSGVARVKIAILDKNGKHRSNELYALN